MGHDVLTRPLKVLHVIPSLSPVAGGPSLALPVMERALAAAGIEVTVATTDDDGPGRHADVPLGQAVKTAGSTRYYFRKQTEFYKCSRPLSRWVADHVTDFDLVHVHALFSHTSNSAARSACRRDIPYVIRPLGVLNRWGMRHRRRWLKWLSFHCVERPILRRAAAMHYTSRVEKIEAEQAGATARAAVIPLGIELAGFENLPGPDLFLARFPEAAGRSLVLFLSRLDAKKGLDLLLPAFASVKRIHPQARLVVAGDGEETLCRHLKSEAQRLGLKDDIIWPGFLRGAEKLSAFAAATVFVLPSYSENFGIALVEAMAAGVPCVTTEGVAVAEDIRERGAGWVVPPDTAPLAQALTLALGDDDARIRKAASARRLAHERFSSAAMGSALSGLYAELVQRPALVHT